MMPLLAAVLLAVAPRLELPDDNGALHRLADYRGKVVLVHFWATWCEPCLTELPRIERLRVALAGKPFVILAVQMAGSARMSSDQAHRLGLGFPMLIDRDSRAAAGWGVNTLPASFLLDAEGNVAYRHVGEFDWRSAEGQRQLDAVLRTAPAR